MKIDNIKELRVAPNRILKNETLYSRQEGGQYEKI